MTQVLHHHGLRHEEGQEVQRTHKDYVPSLKSSPEERTWGKKFIFYEGDICRDAKFSGSGIVTLVFFLSG